MKRPGTPFDGGRYDEHVKPTDEVLKERARVTVAKHCQDPVVTLDLLEMLGLVEAPPRATDPYRDENHADRDSRMAARHERWQAGATDAELAAAEGVSRKAIRCWRSVYNLGCNRERVVL